MSVVSKYYLLNFLFLNVIFQLNSETPHFRMYLFDFLPLFWRKKKLTLEIYPSILDAPCVRKHL